MIVRNRNARVVQVIYKSKSEQENSVVFSIGNSVYIPPERSNSRGSRHSFHCGVNWYMNPKVGEQQICMLRCLGLWREEAVEMTVCATRATKRGVGASTTKVFA